MFQCPCTALLGASDGVVVKAVGIEVALDIVGAGVVALDIVC